MGDLSPRIRAGELRNLVTFQVRSTAIDGYGQQIDAWADSFQAWAKIEPLDGREQVSSGEVQASVSHQITVRYTPALDDVRAVAAMRIVYGARIFDIRAALDVDTRRRAVVILAQEGLTHG